MPLESALLTSLMTQLGGHSALGLSLPAGTPVFAPEGGAARGNQYSFIGEPDLCGAEPCGEDALYDLISVGVIAGAEATRPYVARYTFFFAGASFAARFPDTAPVSAAQVIGVLTDAPLGVPLNPASEEVNLIVLID